VPTMFSSATKQGLPGKDTSGPGARAPGGKEFFVEGEHIIIQLKGKPAVLSTFRDCTETVRHEMAMKEEAELLRLENIHLRSSMKERFRFRNILGKSEAMQEVYELILKAAYSDASAAIFGESGTGKELVARAIHELSRRHDKEFVTVNCGAIPENLLESEFFGHKKGAFTGAYADKAGYLDIAGGGTLFLDEVGELTLNMQVKLLRAIDGGDYTPVGSTKLKKSNFRVIAATNRTLIDLVKEGAMREDFYYRIHVIPITLPPLRERREDIPLLVDHFLSLYRDADQREARIPAKMLDAMFSYPWPGNVRELQNVIRRYLSVGKWDFLNKGQGAQEGSVPDSYSLKGAVEDLEKTAVKKALEQARWNRTRAAQILGISRRALFRKMKRLELY
jgi:transcriptional regulator with PAS, ATPase and Fis domain